MIEKTLDELADYQKKRLIKVARELVDNITEEDVLQPFDYPELENSPIFRYEEGVYSGILSAKAAVMASMQESKI